MSADNWLMKTTKISDQHIPTADEYSCCAEPPQYSNTEKITMRNLIDLSIGKKLLLAFGFLVVIALGVAGIGFYSMSAIFQQGTFITIISDINARQLEVQIAQRDFALTRSADSARQAQKLIGELKQELDRMLVSQPGHSSANVLGEMASAAGRYVQSLDDLVRLTDSVGLFAGREEIEALNTELDKDAGRLLELGKEAYIAQSYEMLALKTRIFQLLGGSVLLLLVVAAGSTLVLQAQIVSPLRKAVAVLHEVAEGNLAVRMDSHRRDEIGQLYSSMQQMCDGLRRLVIRIGDGIHQLGQVAEAFSEFGIASQNTAQEQAQESEQTASAMSQMVASVQEVADNTQQARGAAELAERQAAAGVDVVGETVRQIDRLALGVERSTESVVRLEAESNRIGGVLDVIRSVAEQTNLLALNAAIEAARAGDQGRGFAVVATEVRALARRTQASTAEIDLLTHSLQSIAIEAVAQSRESLTLTQQTVELAGKASIALEEISTAVSLIDQMNQQIAAAAVQQHAVAEDVRRSVTRVRDLADSTASNVKGSAQCGVTLKKLSGELQEWVGSFQVN
jgi:methyl-accepting chemotaxis protein